MTWYWSVGVLWPSASHGLALALRHDPPVPSSASTELIVVEDVRVELHLRNDLGDFFLNTSAVDDIKTAYQETRAITIRDPPMPSSAPTELILVEDMRVSLEEVTI
ncbi:hypothetical protein P7K49_007282 [Saguinus oedipus]|uniref:Uncharacterized protein n=1 Tax=Saguinus oedipus TaxID=9490 RepID=A0ABQ9VV51_SAGOE|nr:hypothetical protein P7K49_007282 [Saguinus oedipus]